MVNIAFFMIFGFRSVAINSVYKLQFFTFICDSVSVFIGQACVGHWSLFLYYCVIFHAPYGSRCCISDFSVVAKILSEFR